MKIKVGVMGSAGGKTAKEIRERAYRLGEAIAKESCVLITGGCPGLPYESVKGAKARGGLVIGISPGLSLDEHIHKYNSPVEGHDVLIYTGSGLMGREITGIRSCDIVIILGGRSGTLGEFSVAYDEGRLIGVLLNTGGIAGEIKNIVKIICKSTGAKIVYSADPEELMEKLLKIYQENPRYHKGKIGECT